MNVSGGGFSERPVENIKNILALHGGVLTWPAEHPLISPSHPLEWQAGPDWLARLVRLMRNATRDRMKADFAKRKKLKKAKRVVAAHLARMNTGKLPSGQ